MRHLTLLAILLTGCTPAATPLLAPVVSTGTSAEIVSDETPPDAALKQLAGVGINSAVLMSGPLKQLGGLAQAFYAARTRHSRAAYTVLDVEGWAFRDGWYRPSDNTPERNLRARFETSAGIPPAWDVALDANYGEGLYTTIPSDLQSFRLEIDMNLPSGGRMATTFIAPIADAPAPLQAYGSGAATIPAPLGNVGYEALNAFAGADGTIDHGDLVLKSLGIGSTLQFSGQFNQAGLVGNAKLYRNGKPAGEVILTGGQWEIKNGKGSFPLQ